jgi:Transposase IS116/IS110/IS902 family
LRRRNHLRHTRAEVYAHSQNTRSQDHLGHPVGRIATPQHRRGLLERFDHRCVPQHMAGDLALVACDAPRLVDLERSLEQTAQGHDPVSLALWRTIPGVGNILALVMRDAIEEITRFPRVQAFVSSCRLVTRARESNGTRHGPSGKTLGNADLQWAFSEAVVRFLTHHAPAQTSLAKRATRHSKGQALSILAHTRGRAVSCMLTNPVAFDQATLLATEGWRARTSLASHGSPRGTRPPFASDRARTLVGHEPAPAVPVPNGNPGILVRGVAVRSAPSEPAHGYERGIAT